MEVSDDKKLIELKAVLETSNINFLVGAGISSEFISCLGNIEHELNKIEVNLENEDDSIERQKLKKSRLESFKKVFEQIIYPNLEIIDCFFDSLDYKKHKEYILQYTRLLKALYRILIQREISTVYKQVNLFTTNYDILLESILEKNNMHFNDGFGCGFSPKYNPNNFKQITLQKGLFLEKHSEIPTFNVVKLHGSISWKKGNNNEYFSSLTCQDIKGLIEECKKNENYLDFLNYIGIIVPSNHKFRDTLLIRTYYELMRFFAAELEKTNTVLFVIGFSFEDAHIKELVEKAANANPTLRVYIFLFKDSKKIFEKMVMEALNKNIFVIKDDKYDISKISDYMEQISKNICEKQEEK